MPINIAQEAIATLLDLAQRGEIDPWDVQVIEVIDRYLSKLALNGDIESGQETADLSQSGQAFLWASMLVLLKANTLEAEAEAEELEEENPETEMIPLDRALPLHLEKHIRRRPTSPPLRHRRVTLTELITQIQEMAVVLASKPPKPRLVNPTPSRKETIRRITQLAHDENLTEMAAQLEQFLGQHLSQITPNHETIDLEELAVWWVRAQQPTLPEPPPVSNHDRVGLFWSLLILSARSKVELSQQEFYGNLSIRPLGREPEKSL